MNTAAILAGGGVRVGLEDAIYHDYDKTRLATNEQLVRRVVHIAQELQRAIAEPNEARRMIGIPDGSCGS